MFVIKINDLIGAVKGILTSIAFSTGAKF